MSTSSHEPQITSRDLDFLRGLFESRVMTLAHAAAIHFSGSREAAKKRTQHLKRARYIYERQRSRPYDPSILSIARRGFETLRRAAVLDAYPAIGWPTMQRRAHVSPFTLRHELDVLSTKAALVAALRDVPQHSIHTFCTWPRLFAFKARQSSGDGYARSLLMNPDAFVQIRMNSDDVTDPQTLSFFVELDRSTETHVNLRGRAGGYLDYYRSGNFAKRRGAEANRFHEHPFRVLWIFRNAERRNNAAESFLRHQPPILTMAWLTTFDEIINHPLGDIWIRPLDYRRVIAGTRFDPARQSPAFFYSRQIEREQLVEARIRKLALLAETQKSDPSLDRL